jgi:hypothetical protein
MPICEFDLSGYCQEVENAIEGAIESMINGVPKVVNGLYVTDVTVSVFKDEEKGGPFRKVSVRVGFGIENFHC